MDRTGIELKIGKTSLFINCGIYNILREKAINNIILFILSYLKTLVLGLEGEKKIPER